ncbi:MAG: 2OG-Fe(II) oxygenase [Pseudomonadota bacterium]|nr:2OG-Fe(II) oxygenase [Pseudomonadota bacterium]
MKILGIQDHIMIVQNVLQPESCDQIISLFERDTNKKKGLGMSASGEVMVNTDKISVDLSIQPSGEWQGLHAKLHLGITECLKNYVQAYPGLQVKPLEVTGYKIQMYEPNVGEFKWHFDALGPGAWSRQLALIFYLNNVIDGGETEFFHQNLKIKPAAGTLLLFPPHWTHVHCGKTPTSSKKYIITSFVEFNFT